MGDWQRNEPSWDPAGRANGPATPLVPRRDVALSGGSVQADGRAREAPRRDAGVDPARGLRAGPRGASGSSPVLPLALTRNEVLERLRTAHWHRACQNLMQVESETRSGQRLLVMGPETVGANTAPRINHKFRACCKTEAGWDDGRP